MAERISVISPQTSMREGQVSQLGDLRQQLEDQQRKQRPPSRNRFASIQPSVMVEPTDFHVNERILSQPPKPSLHPTMRNAA